MLLEHAKRLLTLGVFLKTYIIHYSSNPYHFIHYNGLFQHPLLSSRPTFLPSQGILYSFSSSYPSFAKGVVFPLRILSMLLYWEGAQGKDEKES